MAAPDLVGSEVYVIWGSSFQEKIQNYECKVKQDIGYLFKVRKEMATNVCNLRNSDLL